VTTAATALPAAAPAARPEAPGFWRRFLRKRLAVASLLVIVVVYGTGLLAPWVAPYSFRHQDLGNTFAGPSREHPLGTDRLGRDVLSRLIWSAQTTVIVSACSLLLGGLALGVGLGLLAGYAGGRVDNLIMRLGDVLFALPDIMLLLLITATVRPRVDAFFRDFERWSGIGGIRESGAPDYVLIFGALSLFSWVGMARVVRSQVLALRESEFVLAARALGASTGHILARHLLPNVSPLVIVAATGILGTAAGAEVALSFLGIGVQPPHPSFGVMIIENAGARNMLAHPNLLFVPAAVVGLLLVAFAFLGDALNDLLSPRRR